VKYTHTHKYTDRRVESALVRNKLSGVLAFARLCVYFVHSSLTNTHSHTVGRASIFSLSKNTVCYRRVCYPYTKKRKNSSKSLATSSSLGLSSSSLFRQRQRTTNKSFKDFHLLSISFSLCVAFSTSKNETNWKRQTFKSRIISFVLR